MPNHIELDPGRCDGCGTCVKTCPQLVYSQDHDGAVPVVAAPDRCFGCLACDEDCARGAVRVHRLPDGMAAADVPAPAGGGLDCDRLYDLVVAGGGPAGMGAAIRARMLGLQVAVVERLPSPRRAHHPDGGILFASPDVYTVRPTSTGGLRVEEIDFDIPAPAVREHLYDFMFMAPDGRTTRERRDRWAGFPVVSKDAFCEGLAARARDLGAVVAWNTRAEKLRVEDDGRVSGVEVDGGLVVKGKVVVSAEGITGRLAAGAGVPVNEKKEGWAYAAVAEFPPLAEARHECGFAMTPFPGATEEERKMPALAYWSAGKAMVHVGMGPMQEGRLRKLERPVTDYLAAFLERDLRLAPRLGSVPAASAATMTDGCRAFARRLPRTGVGNGIIATGDAVTACGMMTSLCALRTGDIAAQVAAGAIRNGDVSAAGLAQYDRQVFALSMVKGMQWMHNLLISAPMDLPVPSQNDLFDVLGKLAFGRMMGGGVRGTLAMIWFYVRNMAAIRRRPDLAKYLMMKG